MTDCVVTHVRKDRQDDITHIGVKNSWERTVAQAVTDIRTGLNSYFVRLPQRAGVIVAQGVYRPYLKTTADTTTRNNLDYLPPL